MPVFQPSGGTPYPNTGFETLQPAVGLGLQLRQQRLNSESERAMNQLRLRALAQQIQFAPEEQKAKLAALKALTNQREADVGPSILDITRLGDFYRDALKNSSAFLNRFQTKSGKKLRFPNITLTEPYMTITDENGESRPATQEELQQYVTEKQRFEQMSEALRQLENMTATGKKEQPKATKPTQTKAVEPDEKGRREVYKRWKLTPDQIAVAETLYESGKMTWNEIMEQYRQYKLK